MNKNQSLGEATVQDIQLELIRRTNFNAIEGECVFRSLMEHRDLWQAVILDRIGLSQPGRPPAMGLIKLRDLPFNLWNADTLYILTPTVAAARKLARIHKSEEWCGEVYVFDDPEQVDSALGGSEPGQAIVRVWWD